MTDRQQAREDFFASDREEIAARIAAFKATQEKFAREREEFFAATLRDARKAERPSFWP